VERSELPAIVRDPEIEGKHSALREVFGVSSSIVGGFFVVVTSG
jgi:hypothetical protein